MPFFYACLGNDPATDFRGVGTFGLFLLIALGENKKISRNLFAQSQRESTNFPYCTCLITLCRATLRHLKNGDLNYFYKTHKT